MQKSIADQKWDELEHISHSFNQEQILAMAALSMERMWIPFEIVTLKYYPELVEYVHQCMELIWTRIVDGKLVYKVQEKFLKLFDCIKKIEEDDPDVGSDSAYSNYLLNAIHFSVLCFETLDHKSNYEPISTPIDSIDMVIGYIGDLLPNLTDDELDLHSSVLVEVARMDEDYQLVKNYPNNINEILKKKDYYHNLLILDPYEEKLLIRTFE